MSEVIVLRPLAGLKLRQHINLYTDSFVPKPVIFSARFMLLYAVGLILVLSVFVVLLKRTEAHTQTVLLRAQTSLAQDKAQLTALEARMGAGRRASLEAEIARLEGQVQDRRAILQLLDTRLQRDQVSPARTLAALAGAHRQGIWLTRIHTARGVQEIILEGGALSADRLPGYIEALNAQSPFRQARFRAFSANEPAVPAADGGPMPGVGPSYLHFRLASGVAAEQPAPQMPSAGTGSRP